MPEGPEVKIASKYFNNFFKECKKVKLTIITEYYSRKYKEVIDTVNKNIDQHPQTYCIGKNIFLDLKNKLIFHIHLGMTGGWSLDNQKHCHFYIHSKNKTLFFKDIRKFGKIRIISQQELNKKYNKKFDLLNNQYDFKQHLEFLENNIKPTKSICKILMDQKYFPGVGNYIKSEALYLAKIHPEEKWSQIIKEKRKILIKKTKNIIQKSYLNGGAELRDFNNPFTKSKFKLNIYGKKQTKNNNDVVSILTSDNRKTWFCPKTQILID